MLLELEVKGFALVDHLVLEFEDGLTVLTGETGAGKSVILDSLSFLLGESLKDRAQSECRVAGRFLAHQAIQEFLREQDLPCPEDEVLIVRERKASGRTSSRLNGSLVSISQLKDLSQYLVDFHGQHQSYALTRPSTHLPMLDQMAGPQHGKILSDYGDVYQDYLSTLSQIEEIQQADRLRLREIEWLKKETAEIAEISPQAGELEELEQRIKRGAAAEDLSRGVSHSLACLQNEDAALDLISGAIKSLSGLESADSSLGDLATRMGRAEAELQELRDELQAYSEDLEHNPQALDELLSRAESIKALCRKYGPTVEELLQHQKNATEKLHRLENSETVLAELQAKREKQTKKLTQLAGKLSKNRRRAAADLGKELVAELAQLAMPKVVFQVEFKEAEDFAATGLDQAQFLFSPNPGRAPSPLAETASGGELSRVMLALVSVLSRFQKQPTLIFDEIDAGLGGRTAEAVAAKLSRLSQSMQVVCVTHLPVVAAAGLGHFVVEKAHSGNNTKVSVTKVEAQNRIDEVARMLSGDASQKKARDLASELLCR